MTIITDGGSTKCDWIAIDDNGIQLFEKVRTKGLNPAILTPGELMGRIQESDRLKLHKNDVEHIYFYGAGCGTDGPNKALTEVLEKLFPNAEVVVAEDTLAAIYSTIDNNEPAVVCILGTGSNCSYYNGEGIEQRVKSLGYMLMDDASGNYYGKQMIRDYFFKVMPESLRVGMAERYNMDEDFIKYNLYKQPNPNAYLADFAEFLFLNKDLKYSTDLIKSGIRVFTKSMIMQYKEEIKTVPVHFAGSIAYYAQDEINEVGAEMGFKVGNFVRRPIEGLVNYHAKNIH
ncbi:N-acetylglucosamine kinase [Aureibaculum sp. A20]|uniref:N-acetylglucosamine kinase n=1 Tax=Aureibaculum flavum TaxID=2795986 RepID=A0ABS0WT74_9FLAO|nr:N-acetylglucosamine kinase [Aureibaculum flavum]MBJ2175150.1 N-acetylglucosamine kinase [Aureibaculum flavum]